jgi:hypothetical protein
MRPFVGSLASWAVVASLLCVACQKKLDLGMAMSSDPHLQTNGTVEVSARLLEIPEGAIFQRELYDYATVLKYEVLQVHRGVVSNRFIYVGHYNPFKPRGEAADARVPTIGGTLKEFRASRIHRMALAVPIEDHFMGGIVNKYFGQTTDPIYWAVWTNLE